MSRDFFLLNRCFQVSKLCHEPTGSGCSIPPTKLRGKLPPKLNDFYALLDRVCSIAANFHVTDSAAPSAGSQIELNDDQRRDLEEFERAIVAHRFSADELVKQPAVALIRAIFADASYFSGLKPLPQYTDVFAYELLFPSWLNLLNASMLPRADNGKPRLEGVRQGVMFEFLGKPSALNENQTRLLIGFMTFIASRFDAPHCEDLLQRLIDLVTQKGGLVIDALDGIDLVCKDARELRSAIADYLVVTTSLLAADDPSESTSVYRIAYQRPLRRPLPELVAQSLKQQAEAQQWTDFLTVAHPMRHIIESNHALAAEYVQLLSLQTDKLAQLLSLIAPPSSSGSQVLPEDGQAAVADLVVAQPDLIVDHFSSLQRFACDIAPRLKNFSESAMKYFHRVLIADDSGRKSLLESLDSEQTRTSLVEQLLVRAGRTDDNGRLLNLLICASLIWQRAEAGEAQAALQAIESVIHNRTIGNRELADLLLDLKANAFQALDYLASPMMAAAGKSPRVAALYLTLNEVSQKLATTGTADNFSVVRAKYSKLTNMDLDANS
ncbi:MAG: hypothetical protein KDA72_05240 [Planctomycetales bacterium]|nr:hypothetical protein [Planctomycetales bacterium]